MAPKPKFCKYYKELFAVDPWCKIVNISINPKNPRAYKAILKTLLPGEDDFDTACKIWVQVYANATHSNWVSSRKPEYEGPYFKKIFYCHINKVRKAENKGEIVKLCPATIIMKVRKPEVEQEEKGSIAFIKINTFHDHEISRDIKLYTPTNSTKEAYCKYFEQGLKPSQARKVHLKWMRKVYPNKNDDAYSDPKLNPTQRTIVQLYMFWKEWKDNLLAKEAAGVRNGQKTSTESNQFVEKDSVDPSSKEELVDETSSSDEDDSDHEDDSDQEDQSPEENQCDRLPKRIREEETGTNVQPIKRRAVAVKSCSGQRRILKTSTTNFSTASSSSEKCSQSAKYEVNLNTIPEAVLRIEQITGSTSFQSVVWSDRDSDSSIEENDKPDTPLQGESIEEEQEHLPKEGGSEATANSPPNNKSIKESKKYTPENQSEGTSVGMQENGVKPPKLPALEEMGKEALKSPGLEGNSNEAANSLAAEEKSEEALKSPGVDGNSDEAANSLAVEKKCEDTSKSPGVEERGEEASKSPGVWVNSDEAANSPAVEEKSEETSKSPGVEERGEEASKSSGVGGNSVEAANSPAVEEKSEETSKSPGAEERGEDASSPGVGGNSVEAANSPAVDEKSEETSKSPGIEERGEDASKPPQTEVKTELEPEKTEVNPNINEVGKLPTAPQKEEEPMESNKDENLQLTKAKESSEIDPRPSIETNNIKQNENQNEACVCISDSEESDSYDPTSDSEGNLTFDEDQDDEDEDEEEDNEEEEESEEDKCDERPDIKKKNDEHRIEKSTTIWTPHTVNTPVLVKVSADKKRGAIFSGKEHYLKQQIGVFHANLFKLEELTMMCDTDEAIAMLHTFNKTVNAIGNLSHLKEFMAGVKNMDLSYKNDIE